MPNSASRNWEEAGHVFDDGLDFGHAKEALTKWEKEK